MISLSQGVHGSRGPHDVAAGPAGRGRLEPNGLSGQRRDRGRDGISQGGEVVAALEEAHGPARRGQRHSVGREVGEVARREAEAGERIGAVGVVPGRHEHPVGPELLGRGATTVSSASR